MVPFRANFTENQLRAIRYWLRLVFTPNRFWPLSLLFSTLGRGAIAPMMPSLTKRQRYSDRESGVISMAFWKKLIKRPETDVGRICSFPTEPVIHLLHGLIWSTANSIDRLERYCKSIGTYSAWMPHWHPLYLPSLLSPTKGPLPYVTNWFAVNSKQVHKTTRNSQVHSDVAIATIASTWIPPSRWCCPTESFRCKHFVNCRTAGVVYLMQCECTCFYVGKTKLPFWQQIYRHYKQKRILISLLDDIVISCIPITLPKCVSLP